MDNTDLKAERLEKMSRLGVELSELAGQLKRTFSNYGFIDPDEEPVFVELWKGIIDLEQVLEHNCHDMPPAASKYFSELTGFVQIPTVTGEELLAGYDVREIPWHHPRRLRPFTKQSFDVKTFDGETVCTAEKTMRSKPVAVPDGEVIAYEPRELEGFCYQFRKDGRTIATFDTVSSLELVVPELGIKYGRLITAGNNGLAPEIPKDAILLLDTNVRSYDGVGYYAFARKAGSSVDIAELRALTSGGFRYVSDKSRPETIEDLQQLEFRGKFRFIMVRDRSREERPHRDF